MEVVTIRVQEQVARGVSRLAKELRRSRAEVLRQLLGKAVFQEHRSLVLQRYQQKEITLRTVARELGLPVWKAQELVAQVEFPYTRDDLQRDMQLLEGA